MRISILLTLLTAIVYAQGKPTDKYTIDEASGKLYKLVYESKIWSEAKDVCEREGAKLAVPKTQEEFDFIQKLVRGMYYPDITGTSFKLLVFVGINNLENYKVWKNVDGENIENSDFHTWSGNNGNTYRLNDVLQPLYKPKSVSEQMATALADDLWSWGLS